MKHSLLALLLTLPLSALASTPVENVDKIDTAREGNLAPLVLAHFKKNLSVACEENQLPKFEITKIATDSSNESKTPGTPYNYKGTYLVVQKCLYGSTFVGAYSDPMRASVITGSFHSEYDRKMGPKKMEDLKIELVKDIDLALPTN